MHHFVVERQCRLREGYGLRTSSFAKSLAHVITQEYESLSLFFFFSKHMKHHSNILHRYAFRHLLLIFAKARSEFQKIQFGLVCLMYQTGSLRSLPLLESIRRRYQTIWTVTISLMHWHPPQYHPETKFCSRCKTNICACVTQTRPLSYSNSLSFHSQVLRSHKR